MYTCKFVMTNPEINVALLRRVLIWGVTRDQKVPCTRTESPCHNVPMHVHFPIGVIGTPYRYIP